LRPCLFYIFLVLENTNKRKKYTKLDKKKNMMKQNKLSD